MLGLSKRPANLDLALIPSEGAAAAAASFAGRITADSGTIAGMVRRSALPAEISGAPRTGRLGAVLRDEGASVKPLELFFDLVFVLAITQCTAFMADNLSWTGVLQGISLLAILWWAWVGYSWLTSVVDPEEGAVRIAIFGSMGGLLVASLCVPLAYSTNALPFVVAIGVVRFGQIALFTIASREENELRSSVTSLAISTSIAVGLLLAGALLEGTWQGVLWGLAIAVDYAGPALFGISGWKLIADHFAERHGLIILIAIGESIVAIGVGSGGSQMTWGIVAMALVGVSICAWTWWLYFDVTAIAAARNLESKPAGRERNALARDAYSFIHFPMVAGIVLLALGLKKSLEHVGDPLKDVPLFGLLCGTAIYLIAHGLFRYRNIKGWAHGRLAAAAVLAAAYPVAVALHPPALAMGIFVSAVLLVVVFYEVRSNAELRDRIRHAEQH